MRSLDELSAGDYIVHNVHGIGVFDGIKTMDISGVRKDYIKISYAKGDLTRFFTRPVSCALILLAIIVTIWPEIKKTYFLITGKKAEKG